jgi:hypothetical protein
MLASRLHRHLPKNPFNSVFQKNILPALTTSMRAACLAHPPDFSLKTEYTIRLMLWIHANLKNTGLSRYGSLWWNNFCKRLAARAWQRYVMFKITSFIGLLLLKYQTMSNLLLYITWLKSRNKDIHSQKLHESLVLFTPPTQRPVTHH